MGFARKRVKKERTFALPILGNHHAFPGCGGLPYSSEL